MISNEILVGNALDELKRLPDDSVNCCVTSPPYWGLRNYGHAGQLGLEASPAEYVERLAAVFDQVRRVLRPDGILWLNLGDCYATGAGRVGDHPGGGEQGARWRGDVGRDRDKRRRSTRDGSHAGKNTAMAAMGPMNQPNRMPIAGLKPKDLVGIPWRVAFALQAAGWWLRSDCIWTKPNPMPESTKDRPTRSHEYVFLLSKSEHYYYDYEAVKEPAVSKKLRKFTDGGVDKQRGHTRRHAGFNGRYAEKLAKDGVPATRNLRSVWSIAPQPFHEAHFAVFPEKLAERCILAGTPAEGLVLDPFMGAGTVALVALKQGRRFLGVELNPEYAKIARARIAPFLPANPPAAALAQY